MRLTALLAALIGCSAEGGDASEDCPLDLGPKLELGVGSEAFVSIEDAGAEATLIHGPQGGYHLELGLRAEGLDPSDLASATIEGWVGGEKLGESNTWVQFRCNPATGTSDAWNVRLIYDAQPEVLDDQPTEITAAVTDAAGNLFETSTTLKIVDPLVP